MSGRLRRRGAAALLGLAAALVALVACGVPNESEPRALEADEVPEALASGATTSTTAPDPDAPSRQVEIWFLDNELLQPEFRELEVGEGAARAVEALLDGTTEEERAAGVSSSIPAGTELLGSELEGDRFTVELSEEFTTVAGSELRNAVAQIVFTATGYPDVERVRFRVDGDLVQVPVAGGGTEQVVTRAEYESLAPPVIGG